MAQPRVFQSIMTYYQDYSEAYHKPGFVYCIEAVGFGGLIPGLWQKRIKIGISNNPERRVHELAGTQPPCNFTIIHQVYVIDMASVEDSLHEAFEHKHVELDRSTEWFSLNPLELKYLIWLMKRYAANRRGISYKQFAIGLARATFRRRAAWETRGSSECVSVT